MTANTRNGMRPNGRSPPFLAIGLTVALVILGFNYWSLSARNGEQANEIAVLESEMRLMNAKKISAEKRSEAISDKVKDLEVEISKQKAVVADKMGQLANIGTELDRIKSEKQGCDVEFQKCEHEKVPACMKEKENLQMELASVNDALEKERNQQRDATCDESKCSAFAQAEREKLMDSISAALGPVPIYTLYKNGVNVGKYEEQARQMAAQRPEDNIKPGSQNNVQPIVDAGNVGNSQQHQQQQQNEQQQQQQSFDQANQPLPGAQPQPLPQDPQKAQGAPADPNVVELPQIPNPDDGQPKANLQLDGQNQDIDRIQPNADSKLVADTLDDKDIGLDNADDVEKGDYNADDDVPPKGDADEDEEEDEEEDGLDNPDDTLRVPVESNKREDDQEDKGGFDEMRRGLENNFQQ